MTGVTYPACYRDARNALALGHFTRQPAARRRRAEAEVVTRLSLIDHHVKTTFQRGTVNFDELAVDLRDLLQDVEVIPARLLEEVMA